MLKSQNAGLSKQWRPRKTLAPWYRGELLLTGSTCTAYTILDNNIILYDLESGETLWKLGEDVSCFSVAPNEDSLLLSTHKGLLMHYQIVGQLLLRSMKGHQMPVTCMAHDPSGALCATGSADRSVRVWDVAKGYCTHSFRDHEGVLSALRFHPDPASLLLYSCCEDAGVRCFDLRASRCTMTSREHMGTPTALAFNTQGSLAISCGRDKVLPTPPLAPASLIAARPQWLGRIVLMPHLALIILAAPSRSLGRHEK